MSWFYFQEEQSRLGMMRVHVDRLCMKEKEARSIIAELKTGDFGAVKRVRTMRTWGAGFCKIHFSLVSYNLRGRQLDCPLKKWGYSAAHLVENEMARINFEVLVRI